MSSLVPLLGDLLGAATAVAAVAAVNGASPAATALLAPALFLCVNWAAGLYTHSGGRGSLSSRRIALDLLLTSGVFALSVSLLQPSALGDAHLAPLAEMAIWLSVFGLSLLSRVAGEGLRSRLGPTRWLVVGDAQAAWRLRRALADDGQVHVVAASPLPVNGSARLDSRSEAMQALKRFDVSRVVLAPPGSDPQATLELIHTYKSLGMQVSVLSPLLDVLDQAPGTANAAGGVSVIDIGALTVNGHGSNGNGSNGSNGNGNGKAKRRNGRLPRVSVVIPTRNEAANLSFVFGRLPEGLHEVILVDGHSTDDTVEVANRLRPGIRVLRQSGHGKGDALRTGFAAVTGDIIVTLDADGSADPGEIPIFVEELRAGADFAKGSRFASGGGSDDITPLRKTGNWVLNATTNLLYGTHYSDLCYGYNAFWAHCLPYIALDVPGFEVETLMNLRVAKAGLKVSEVPSFEAKRLHGQSNLNTFRDGFRVLRTILEERNWHAPTSR